jgi:uncharacterized membrane protein YkoI
MLDGIQMSHNKEIDVTRTTAFSAAIGLCITYGLVQADEKFEKVRVYFEQNVRDQDAEVKFEATGGDAGLVTLEVTAPDGRTVIDFKASDSKLGIRHLVFESPEPKNDGRVQVDFPAGVYTFTGSTTSGAKLQGPATLSHNLPAPTSFVRPRPDEKNVPVNGLKISWSAVKNLSATVVIIEQEKSGRELRVNLPGDATAFAVPHDFLNPGMEYKLSVGTVSKEGNASFTETAFTTLAQNSSNARDPAAGHKPKGGSAISQEEAKQIALKAVPGKVTDVTIEKKLGANRYVVEVISADGGKEVDVIIDMKTGKVLALDK